jgi:hypothetical protein
MNWKSILSGVLVAILTALVLWLVGVIGRVPTIIVPGGAVVAFKRKPGRP